mmetsp:Transcript_498/g.746  ORF Transcript_498/g.746 Transcript_498/m.746 type:complete len:98 (+) Transcript_498:1086-1379(+)
MESIPEAGHNLGNPFRKCMAGANCMTPSATTIGDERTSRRNSNGNRLQPPGMRNLTSPTSVAMAVYNEREERYSTAGSIGADSTTGVVSEYFTFERR